MDNLFWRGTLEPRLAGVGLKTPRRDRISVDGLDGDFGMPCGSAGTACLLTQSQS